MRIFVIGKNGQLGSEIKALVPNFSEIDFLFPGSSELDITDKNVIRKFVNDFKPDLIINCAAYTAVDNAEEKKEEANAVNHLGVRNLAEICEFDNIRLIHISTDYVFNGQADRPYKESDPTDPINEYGSSKLKGEQAIAQTAAHAVIIRTSWVYSSFGNNFVKTMIRLGREKEQINVVADLYGSPTNAKDLEIACIQIALLSDRWHVGTSIYHFSNKGVISWFEFAKEIMQFCNLKCIVNPIRTDQYPTKSKCPKYSALNNERIKEFRIELIDLSQSLKSSLMIYKNYYSTWTNIYETL